MTTFRSYFGWITAINDFWTGSEEITGCYKRITVQSRDGSIANLIVAPDTYVVDQTMLVPGDPVIGFYDANAPVPMIYPPQYNALVMAKITNDRFVEVDYFNSELTSSDGTLKLNIGPTTLVLLENGQRFNGSPANRNLIVIYGPTTMSIPAQTTPYRIIVMCQRV